MYFPYLRGKQFELIALRELCGLFPERINNISPLIEPVKLSSTLKSTLRELANHNVNFSLVINPRVGDLIGQYEKIFEIIRVFYLMTNGIPIVAEYDQNTKINNDYLSGIKATSYNELIEKGPFI